MFNSIGIRVGDNKPKSDVCDINDQIITEAVLQMCTHSEDGSRYVEMEDGLVKKPIKSIKNIILEKLLKLVSDKIVLLDNDFRDIAKCQGDITKYKNYKLIYDSIKVITELAKQQNALNLPVVKDTILLSENLVKYTKDLKDAFSYDIQPIMHYFTMGVASMIYALTFITTTMIDYERKEGILSYQQVFVKIDSINKGLPKYILQNIEMLNRDLTTGSIKKAVTEAKNYKGSATTEDPDPTLVKIVTGILIAAAILVSPAIIRWVILFFVNLKIKLREFIDEQSNFLEANILMLKDKNTDPNIIKKQEEYVTKMKNFSARLAGAKYVAEKDTERQANDEDKVIVKEADQEAKETPNTDTGEILL